MFFGASLFVSLTRAPRLAQKGDCRRAVAAACRDDFERRTRAHNGHDGRRHLRVDCVGSEASITEALRIVKPKGRITLVGMPNNVSLNLTNLWHRETHLVGAYAYGTESMPDGTMRRTFDVAMELVRSADLGRLVSATYPLRDYRDALEHAANSGRRGAVKVAFDLRNEKERNR